MGWTRLQQLELLMRLPWTVNTEREADGTLVSRVAELPSVIATGANERELGRDLWESLETTLEAYLEHGDPVPVPSGVSLPWNEGKEPAEPPFLITGRLGGEAWVAASGSAQLRELAV